MANSSKTARQHKAADAQKDIRNSGWENPTPDFPLYVLPQNLEIVRIDNFAGIPLVGGAGGVSQVQQCCCQHGQNANRWIIHPLQIVDAAAVFIPL